MQYTHSEPAQPRHPLHLPQLYPASLTSPPSLTCLPSYNSPPSYTPPQKGKFEHILQHNQQLLKENDILSQRLASTDKLPRNGTHSFTKPSLQKGQSDLTKALTQVKKQRDELRRTNQLLEKNSLKNKPCNDQLQGMTVLERRLSQIQKRNSENQVEIQRLQQELSNTSLERDNIMKTYHHEKEVSSQIIQSMKTDIQQNKEKERRVVEIVRILEKEKRDILTENQQLREMAHSTAVPHSQELDELGLEKELLEKRVKALEQEVWMSQETIQQLNSTIVKKDTYIMKSLAQHKCRLTKALQCYIERVGISKKLKPAELLRERSSVLSEWDLNLDIPVESE